VRRTHAGVVEFIAEEGKVFLPAWTMRMLQLNEGDPIHIQGTRLPKGRFVKLQPQTVDFLEISDPKAVLEQALRNYPTLTPGDIIEISYNCLTFEILIMEVVPDAEGISIIETDLEVDFAPPKGYVEPAPKPKPPPPTLASKLKIDQGRYDTILPSRDGTTTTVASGEEATPGSMAPFKGAGQTLSGKKTKGRKNKPVAPRDPNSLVRSTDRPNIVTNDTLLEEKKVPAALNLPFGTLFFGYNVKRLDVPVSEEQKEAEQQEAEQPKPAAFSGEGQVLGARSSRGTKRSEPERQQPEVIEVDSD